MTKIEETSNTTKKVKKQNPIHRLFKLFDAKQKWKAIVALLLVGISATCDLSIPMVTGIVIKNAPHTASDVDNVPWYLFGVMGGLALISICVQMLSVKLVMTNMTDTSSKIRTRIFTQTRYLSAQDIDKIGHGSILTITTNDVTQVEQFLSSYNSQIIKSMFFGLGGLGLSLYSLAEVGSSQVWYAAIAYIFIFIIGGVAGAIMKKAMPNFKKARVAVDNNNLAMQENIVGAKLIRTLNLEKLQARKYNKGNTTLKDHLTKSEKAIAFLVPIVTLFINMAMMVIYIVGGLYAWWSPDTIAEKSNIIPAIFQFTQYLALVLLGLMLFSGFGYTISRARVSLGRIFDLLDTKNSITEAKDAKPIKDGSIELHNVTFKYKPEEPAAALKNLNLKVKSGESLGIIGQTGSGKSSLVKILTRLYDVSSGEVKLSGTNIKDIKMDSLRNDIAVSLQEKVIMSGTYKSNIKIGKPRATDKEVLEAAKAAEAWEFISKKEKQLDGIVEERGSNLSGGQKQRLAIARALIKNPKILIFDDSTSALDTITEKKIMNNINTKMKGVTKIIISQKVKSIQKCDQIIVLDNGRIVQQGTHAQLLKDKKGVYARIHDSQKTSLEG